ncbi:MAG: 2-hydroxyacid dehydrogenase [Microcystis sp. LE19-84.1B]|jgi:D-lactate dehydrogenase|uniref:2-hydroxyacid dehydrogenase n=1 Tax=Microcystis sp. LE19-84.1B TaxID=3016438 RepID=UPI001D684001|nr:2-hydroxyacid dehydrogenase [Microcystis sp. LE19-84.1B]MCZ8225830.1 2-hydroxyacid dehydrogenase [Microcystis sp. LE19-84.1B]NCS31213.1 2-hydroxyacid dehydrogenase [Microcystis aeruginosa F13-15]
MKVAVFSTEPYDRIFLDQANTEAKANHELVYFESRLEPKTVSLADGFPAICVFVNDNVNSETLEILAKQGTRLIALRCTGFNNVDIAKAAELGIKVVRVTVYSPYSVAEFVVAMIQVLNRKLHRAYNRIRDDNFSLNGLMGFDLHGRTVGIIGTGKIGIILGEIMHGFGCHLLGYDLYPNPKFEAIGDASYVDLPELLGNADIISLHCPLTPENHYLINADTIAQMKPSVTLINTSRGKLIDTKAVIDGIKSGQIGSLGLDVYEQEDSLFFRDLSGTIIQDDYIQLLQSFPNVLITSHQGFFTEEAISAIANTTIASITDFEQGNPLKDAVKPPK